MNALYKLIIGQSRRHSYSQIAEVSQVHGLEFHNSHVYRLLIYDR